MIYNIKNNNYCNFDVFSINQLDARSYFIPYKSKVRLDSTKTLNMRYHSDKVQCLNGMWDFRYFEKFESVPSSLNTEEILFDKVKVPSCWQFTGYEPPFYVNQPYQFLSKPPLIPTDKPVGRYLHKANNVLSRDFVNMYNSTGVYRTFINAYNLDKTYIISFLGVASSIDLFVNGSFVGYGEGSHNTQEFNITDYLQSGANEILVVVHKWSNGTYLECQDMFRNNGIFRDVLLFINDKEHIYDIAFETEYVMESTYNAKINVQVVNPETTELEISLYHKNRLIGSKTAKAECDNDFSFNNLIVSEWNAETPYLYDLYITLTRNGETVEVIKKKVGFKNIEIRGNVFYFNNKKIKLKGVNHHDSSPKTGYYLTPEDIEKDIKVMKDFNVNTVRTSHYPPDPMFIELCDEYGLYVIDEADIETHGTCFPVYKINQISDNLAWKNHYWDRVFRMFMRDKNSTSITMWSLGNEAGGIKCHDYCYNLLKPLTNIPVHYEGAIRTKVVAYDVVSMMYPEVKFCQDLVEGTLKTNKLAKASYDSKPYFLCEFAHAMGVGPGSLEEYFDVMESHDNFLGGCIWEFVDHAVYHKDGPYKYTYGGDHNEHTHDSNFCVDGLFFPDRSPHTGALNMQYVFRPIKANLLNNHFIEFTNTNRFKTVDDIICYGQIQENGKATYDFEIKLNIEPLSKTVYEIIKVPTDKDVFINLVYCYPGKKFIAKEQIKVNEKLIEVPVLTRSKIKATDNGNVLMVEFEGGSVSFNKSTATLISYNLMGAEILGKKEYSDEKHGRMYDNIFRAPLDNDMYFKKKWLENKYDNLVPQLKEFIIEKYNNKVILKVTFEYMDGKKVFVNVQDRYTIYSNGVIEINSIFSPIMTNKPFLPRIGKVLELNSDFENVTYYGRGGKENYPDVKNHALVGIYELKATDFMEKYIKPQESGNRCDVRYALFKNSNNKGIMILADTQPLNINVKLISDKKLNDCKHQEDIINDDKIYVNIDGFMMGVGSNSCGPRPLEKYLLNLENKTYEYSFKILPIIGDITKILGYII